MQADDVEVKQTGRGQAPPLHLAATAAEAQAEAAEAQAERTGRGKPRPYIYALLPSPDIVSFSS